MNIHTNVMLWNKNSFNFPCVFAYYIILLPICFLKHILTNTSFTTIQFNIFSLTINSRETRREASRAESA